MLNQENQRAMTYMFQKEKKKTMKSDMVYPWNVIQKHPTGLGVRNA